jgi:outer membrane protein TolC
VDRRHGRTAAILAVAFAGGAAHAADPRAVTYQEVLRSVADQHPLVAGAAGSLEAAEGGLLESQGAFDPLWRTAGNWSSIRDTQYLTAGPYIGTDRLWDLYTDLEGTAATGTTWIVATGIDHLHHPTVVTDILGNQSETTIESFRTEIYAGIAQQLLRGATLAANLQSVRAARASVDAARHAGDATRQDALAGSAHAYWAWVQAQGELEIAKNASDVANNSLRLAQAAAAQGGVSSAHVARLEASAAQFATALRRAEIAAGQAEDQVRSWLGEGPGEPWTPATPPGDGAASTLDPAAVAAAVREGSPALLAARADVEAARAAERGSRTGRLPTLTATAVGGVAGRSQTDAGDSAAEMFRSTNLPFVTIGGELIVPLGNRAGRGEQRTAEGELAVAESEVARLERETEADAIAQVRALAAAQDEIAQADIQVRALGEALAAEEVALARGGSHPLFVLEQRQALVEARVEALDARTRWRHALTELQRLEGTLGTDLP